MFRIGDFSTLTQVTVKALRHYDDIGLFKPAKVAENTGYRYYSADQLPKLNRILALKDLGFTLEEIGKLLVDDLTVDQIRGMFLLRKTEVQDRIAEHEMRLRRVESRLQFLEKENIMSDYEVVVKDVPSQKIASIQDIVPTYKDIGVLFSELFSTLGPQGAAFAGPSMTIYHCKEYKERDIEVEVAMPVSNDPTGSDRIKVRALEGVKVASLVHVGPYDSFMNAYNALMKWIEDNKYTPSGPPREIYLKSIGDTEDPAEYVTEIQMPVEAV